MSQEVFEIVQGMDLENIENQLALQCAPLITGLKVSNLLIVHKDSVPGVKKILENTGISYVILAKTQEKTMLLLYKADELAAYMERKSVKKLLTDMGYENHDLYEVLLMFQSRFRHYQSGCAEFPHEMVILLGYPVEDVHGFIKNKGKNSLYSGYWKVYENLPAKMRLFHKYDQSKETVIQLVSCGVSIIDVIELYSDKTVKMAM